MLQAERRPPVASGFAAMTAHHELSSRLDDVVRSDIDGREPDPYASHPTLRQRLEALGVPVEGSMPAPPEHTAAELLADVPAAEQELLELRFGEELRGFAVTGWDDAGQVHLDHLRKLVDDLGDAFAGLPVTEAGTAATTLAERRDRLRELLGPEDGQAPDEAVDDLALSVLNAYAAVHLAEAGCEVTAPPGEPVRVRHQGETLEPYAQLERIASGEDPASAWSEHPVVRATSAQRAV
jgi:hypothetical protein